MGKNIKCKPKSCCGDEKNISTHASLGAILLALIVTLVAML